VGGVGPYLGLFARAGLSREAIDAALAKREIHELPSARGCTYVLPSKDFALGLRVGQPFAEAPLRVADKLGVTRKEVDRLSGAVLRALTKDALDPAQLREAVGTASRSLGEAGKRKGVTTTLPLALGHLQSTGEIRRVPVDGRLDGQRYRYERWEPNPLAAFKLSDAEAATALARKYFSWIGPATLGELRWFTAWGAAVAKAACEPLKLVPMEPGSDRMLLPEDRDAFAAFSAPKKPHYALVSSVDGMSLLRRDVRSLVDAGDLGRKVPAERALAALGGLTDLNSHAILDRGRLVGLWEFDVEAGSIAWKAFVPKSPAIVEAVKTTESFVRDQLGDARSFSLDSPKSRVPRIRALRAVG
jgi:hypothetical protein